MKTLRQYAAGQLPDSPYFVLLADEHAIVRMGLKTLIGNIDPTIKLYEASNGEDIIRQLGARRFDLLILDINMRQTESFSLVAFIRREFPLLKVLIYTMNNELIFATRFLRWGVSGYLLKQSSEAEIVKAFESVRSGNIYISDPLSRTIVLKKRGAEALSPFELLTDREFEVVLQLVRGSSAEEIAKTLHLNKSTVGTHKCRIMKKLKVENMVELLQLAGEYQIT